MEQNNYLGQEKVWKLLFKFSLPCVLSMVIGALYNIVDQLFIGNSELGYIGNAATSVVYPITIIVLAFGLMWGDGCATYLSICQGKKETDNIHHAVGSCVTYSAITGILISIICLTLADPILSAFGASGETLACAKEYLYWLTIGMPFYLVATMLVSVVRADGAPGYSMAATVSGCVVNIILDPVFIYGFKMGIAGAAIATVIGQLTCFVYMMIYIKKFKTFRLSFASLKPQGKEVFISSKFGISSFLTNISTVILSIVTNVLLAKFGVTSAYGADIPIAVIGIVFKVFGVIISIAVGIAVGGQPILGYNFGAGNMKRVRETFYKVTVCNLIVGAVATVLVEAIPQIIIGWFGEGGELYIQYAVLSFRIYLATIMLTCLSKGIAIFFQSIGKPFTAIAVALSRDIVFLIPSLFILSGIGGADKGVEMLLWSAPIADGLCTVLCAILVFGFLANLPKEKAVLMENISAEITVENPCTDKIITIGRSYGAGAKTIGRKLAESLNIPYYDSDLIGIAAERFGLSQKYLESVDEKPLKIGNIYGPVGLGIDNIAEKAQREIIEKLADEGPCVIVGRRADRILEDRANAISVFISASVSSRAKRIAERDGLTTEKAYEKISKVDRERENYYNQNSSKTWGKAETYDFCFNTDKVCEDKIISIILDVCKK